MAELEGPKRIDKAKGLRERRLAGSLAMNQFQKSVDENAERVQKDRENLQKLKRQAYDSNEMAEKLAAVKKTGGKQVDEQIIEQITLRGNELAKAHIQAYGPDGSPEMIAAYTKQKAQVNKDLDDLTMFIGTLDAELEARDKAIDDGTFIQDIDENGERIAVVEKEQFKNGIFNGESDVTLSYVPGQGYNLSGYNAMLPSPKNQNLNLNEYAENLRKNGTGYKAISPNAEGAMSQYGSSLIESFGDQADIKFSNMYDTIKNKNHDPKKHTDPTAPGYEYPTKRIKRGYKTTDINKVKQGLTASLSKPGFNNFTDSKGQPIKLPPENQMWAQLQKAGYLNDLNYYTPSTANSGTRIKREANKAVSWSQYKNPKKEEVLKKAYVNYLIDTQFPDIDPTSKDIITTDQTVKQSIPTNQYNKK